MKGQCQAYTVPLPCYTQMQLNTHTLQLIDVHKPDCQSFDVIYHVKGLMQFTLARSLQTPVPLRYWLVISDGSCRLQFQMLHTNTCISLWTNYLPATSIRNYWPVPYTKLSDMYSASRHTCRQTIGEGKSQVRLWVW